MGCCLAKKIDKRVVMIGLDAAGKTTSLYRLRNAKDTGNTEPTLNYNLEVIPRGAYNLVIWDLGGQIRLRQFWKKYMSKADAIILVMDSADQRRFDEARKEAEKALGEAGVEDPNSRTIPLIVLANKQDMPQAVPADKLASAIALDELAQGRAHTCLPTSARNGEGLWEGIDWLVNQFAARSGQ
eukprot:m51a1_g4512 putative adp-ribosylation factor (184) ;mRNA; f:401125-402309